MSATAPQNPHVTCTKSTVPSPPTTHPQLPQETPPFPGDHHAPLRLSCWVPGLLVGLPPTALPKHGPRPCVFTRGGAHHRAPTTQATESRQKDEAGGSLLWGGVELGDTDGKTKDRAPALGQHSRTRSASGQDKDSGAQQRTQSRSRGLFRSPRPAGRGAGSWDAWPSLQRLLEVLPVSGSTGHQGNARPTSLPTVTHSVAAHPHLTRWPCRAVPSQAMLTGCSLTCTVTREGQNTCTAKRNLVTRRRSDQGKGRVPDPAEHQSWERPGSGAVLNPDPGDTAAVNGHVVDRRAPSGVVDVLGDLSWAEAQ